MAMNLMARLAAAIVLAGVPGLLGAQMVTGVSGSTITLSLGSQVRVSVGMSGKVCYREEVAGSAEEFCPAKFEVTEVRETSATARVTKGDPSAVAKGFRVRFDQPVVPSSAARRPAQTPAPLPSPSSGPGSDAEIAFWNSVKDSDDPDELQLFLDKFPNGTFAALATKRLARLSDAPATVVPPPAAPSPLSTGRSEVELAPSGAAVLAVASPPRAAAVATPGGETGRAVKRGDLVALGPGVTPPVIVSVGKPTYPASARRLKVEGVVVLGLLVDEEGQVVEARVVRRAEKEAGFEDAALEAARSARFRPATKDGIPVKVWYELRIPFKL